MGQDSSQIEGESHNADGVIIKRDPEEKENENFHDLSNWDGIAAKEGLENNGTKKAPEGRKKKRRKRRSSSSSKATFETARDRFDPQSLGEGRDTPSLRQRTQETIQTNRVNRTPSSVSRNPKIAEVEAKKMRLLAVVSAAAGDVNSPYSDTEINVRNESGFNDVNQHSADDTDQGSQNGAFTMPAKKVKKSNLISKRAIAGKANSRWAPKAIQSTGDSSASKKAKNKQTKSRLVSNSLATNEEGDATAGLQLPTPNDSSQVYARQPLEDPFTGHNIKDSQTSQKKRYSNPSQRDSTGKQKQRAASLDKAFTDEDASYEDLARDQSASHELHRTEKTSGSHHSILPLGTQTKAASIGRQPLDQAMDLIDPALREIGADLNQPPLQIGIYTDLSTPQTAGKRKRRLPVDEATDEQMPDSEPKTKKPRKKSLKPKTPDTDSRKSQTNEFRDESPDLDGPPTKIKRRRSTQKKVSTYEPTAKGKFSQKELDIIQNEMVKYRERYDITSFDLNQIIQDTPGKLAALWDEICEALPDRPRASMVKVCRRKFHNFGVRGKWTKEEDQELKEVYERLPKCWKQIGQLLNRHHEDVRDRWRNYIVCGDSMKREQWTEEEENNLRSVVSECIQAVRELKAADIARNPGIVHDPRPDVELVDWQIVSEKFGRTRSRLQCLDKWNRLTRLEDSEGGSKELELGPNSWRVKTAYKDVKHMRREDYLELLIALRSSHAGREGKVNWAKLGDLDLRIKWTCMARKVAWKKLRASVPGNEQMKFQDIVTLLLNNLPENDAELEGADGEVDTAHASPFVEDAPSPQRRSLSEAISSADEDENETIDPNLDQLDEGDFDPDDIQGHPYSISPNPQKATFNRDLLREAIGEAYFDSGNTDGEDQDSEMALASRASVDLDVPSQQRSAGRRISRLRSPISFKVAPHQAQPVYANSTTHSDEDDLDMDIPARRPTEGSRRESVDLDMD